MKSFSESNCVLASLMERTVLKSLNINQLRSLAARTNLSSKGSREVILDRLLDNMSRRGETEPSVMDQSLSGLSERENRESVFFAELSQGSSGIQNAGRGASGDQGPSERELEYGVVVLLICRRDRYGY